MVKIVMSSGHGLYVRGAAGPEPWGLDEVDEARKVVEAVADRLRKLGVDIVTFHDNVSKTQDENLERIVDFHNAQGPHDLDASCHFNAYIPTSDPMGCEVWYVTQDVLAEDVSATMADSADFINRGPKYTDGLYFLNNTANPAILLEVCFVDSEADAELYRTHFDSLCEAIATTLAGRGVADILPEVPDISVPPDLRVTFSGKCSYFGGPNDMGVDADEDLAWWDDPADAEENPHLFLPNQPPGTTGLARRLDPVKPYVACRWDYDVTPKSMLADPTLRALIRNYRNNVQALAWPADWGPHEDTGRAADLSPGLMEALQLQTDDEVEVIYPAPTLIISEEGEA